MRSVVPCQRAGVSVVIFRPRVELVHLALLCRCAELELVSGYLSQRYCQ
jgi:hypothetical protein